MPQYDNPASFLEDPQQAAGIPGLQGAMIGIRARQAEPFMQELLKQQQMNTSKQQTELGEFQGPLAQMQRQAERQKVIDEGNVFHETMKDSIAKSHEAARLLPHMTDEQIAKAKLDAQQHGHLFQTAPATYFTGIHPFLESMKKQGMTDEQIAPIYDKFVQNSGFPVNKLDPELQKWGPSTFGALTAHRFAQVYTPEFEQKYGLAQVPAEASKSVARINVAGALEETNRRIKAGQFDSDQHVIAALEHAIATGKDRQTDKVLTPAELNTAKDQLRRYKGAKVLDAVNKDPLYSSAAIMAMTGDPKATQAAEKARVAATQRAMQTLGIRPEDLGQTPQQGGAAKYTVGQMVRSGGIRYRISRVDSDGTAYVNTPTGERAIK